MTNHLAIIGDGGHANDIETIALQQQTVNGRYNAFPVGYIECIHRLDDKNGTPIEEQWVKLLNLYGSDLRYVLGVNSSQVRRVLEERMRGIFATPVRTLVHTSASIGQQVRLGYGVVIGQGVVLTNRVTIGDHVHLNSHVSVNQNSSIGSFSTLSPGARVCGDCVIGETVQMGANSTVINLVSVANRVIMGAGAVATRHLDQADTTYVGIPAKPIVYTTDTYDSSDINV
jgi:sugar O-acyltransferase (sialic acid O-acetyltransferase NeuD family)